MMIVLNKVSQTDDRTQSKIIIFEGLTLQVSNQSTENMTAENISGQLL